MIPVIGSLVMGLCSGALFWATASIGRRNVAPVVTPPVGLNKN